MLCTVAARSAAMTFNRLADARLDALNPRTAGRAVPRGMISPAAAWAFFGAACVVFVAAALWLARSCQVVTVAALLAVGGAAGLGVLYYVGVACVALLLIVENALVSPGNLRRVNLAFFAVNRYGQCSVPSPNTGFVGVAGGECHSLGLRYAVCGGDANCDHVVSWGDIDFFLAGVKATS